LVLNFTVQPSMQLGRQLFHRSPAQCIFIEAGRSDRIALVDVEPHLPLVSAVADATSFGGRFIGQTGMQFKHRTLNDVLLGS
jgi:hypothetical protein